MKKQITTIMLGILMLSGAIAMYAGDTISFETNLTNPVYTVTGNASSLEGLNITFENGNITISPALNYKPDNFTIIFFDNITREVVKTIHTRGRSRTRIEYVDNNVTVYVPEYINTTEIVEVEVEKIIDNVIIIDNNGFKLWQILTAMVVGIFFGAIVFRNKKGDESDVEETD